MRCTTIHEAGGQRTLVAILDIDDEVIACLRSVAERERLSAASVTAIGAFRQARLAFWDWDSKEYQEIPVREQVEVISLNGDIALDGDGKPKLHLHSALGRRDGSVVGGHVLSGTVRPTLEVLITESPAHLQRAEDEMTGLPLIRLNA